MLSLTYAESSPCLAHYRLLHPGAPKIQHAGLCYAQSSSDRPARLEIRNPSRWRQRGLPLLKARHIPNLITGLRILLVAPFLWLLLKEHYGAALLLFVIAGVSDALDGFLAKYYGWTSELGGLLDPLADKLLLMGAILALGWLNELPSWLVTVVVARDLLILGGATAYHLLIERLHAAPLMISKLNTLVQLMLVCAIIFNHGLMPLPAWLLSSLIYLTVLTTLWSGAAYIWRWGWHAWRHSAQATQSRRDPP
jgi:cardiolipin synthase (CMP-forming)